MVGVLIFSLVMFSYFYYVGHRDYSDEALQSTLLAEAKAITNYLVTEGYPPGWTAANVSTVGLTGGDMRINQTKLDNFDGWGYEERRSYLHTTKDYYFFIQYINGTKFNDLCEDPDDGCVKWNASYNLVQSTRLAIYDHDLVRLVLYVYQEP
jgi:hypothetical protein